MEVGKVIKVVRKSGEDDENLLWVYQNGNILPGKKFTLGKISGKMTLPPQKNMAVTPLKATDCRPKSPLTTSN